MLRVGLTGSIAVGKSHVLAIFRELGCKVLDADQLAHEAIMAPSPAYHELVQQFGDAIVGPDREIDRARLGEIVFADATKRARLNAIVHPRVRDAIASAFNAFAADDPHGVAVVDAALIIESGMHNTFDRLVVVYCEPKEQLRRLMERDKLGSEEASRRISAQLTSDEKRQHADFEIDTTGSVVRTRSQVVTILEKLRAQAMET